MNRKQLINRILQMVIVLFGISFFTFALTYLSPGDPAEIMLTECGNVPTPELLTKTRADLGRPGGTVGKRIANYFVQVIFQQAD